MSESGAQVFARDTSLPDDEVDLRSVVNVLVSWRREIAAVVLIAILCSIAFLVITHLLVPQEYEASATVAIARVESSVNFDPQFKTDSQQVPVTDARARRSALLGLARNSMVAETVTKELGDTLNAEEQNPSELMQRVKAVISSQDPFSGKTPTASDLNSDLIRIVARADSPNKAALIANAWAKAYVDQVNSIYGQLSNGVSPSVEAQLAKARVDYQAAETNLQSYLPDSKTDETRWKIAAVQAQLADAYDAYLNSERALADARALRTQVAAGGDAAAATNAAALQLLKIQSFANRPSYGLEQWYMSQASSQTSTEQTATSQAAGLQLQLPALPEVNSANMLADLDGLIQALEKRQSDIAAQISALSSLALPQGAAAQEAGGSVPDAMAALQSNLRKLNTQLEADGARTRELTQQRDLAWDTYRTLSSKVAELSVAQAAANSEVRYAAPALPPTEAVTELSPAKVLVLAAVIGLILGVAIALFANYLGKPPFLSARPSSRRRVVAA